MKSCTGFMSAASERNRLWSACRTGPSRLTTRAKNIERVYEYTMRIDPDGTMPKDELRHLMRMKFPEFDF